MNKCTGTPIVTSHIEMYVHEDIFIDGSNCFSMNSTGRECNL